MISEEFSLLESVDRRCSVAPRPGNESTVCTSYEVVDINVNQIQSCFGDLLIFSPSRYLTTEYSVIECQFDPDMI